MTAGAAAPRAGLEGREDHAPVRRARRLRDGRGGVRTFPLRARRGLGVPARLEPHGEHPAASGGLLGAAGGPESQPHRRGERGPGREPPRRAGAVPGPRGDEPREVVEVVVHRVEDDGHRSVCRACRQQWATRIRACPQHSPVRPDGFFSLQFPELPEGRNRDFFMLEADRSTMTRERFVRKLMAYQAWYDTGSHTATLGIKNFRVLAVTKSDDRLRSLLRAIAETTARVDLGRCWFVSQARFVTRPASILEPIWESAADDGKGLCLLPRS